MNELEKTQYLANLMAVARADGKISPNEQHIISAVQKRIGVTKKHLNKAELLAESVGFVAEPVGLFSENIANLEDMLVLSFIDGTLDQTEKPVILEFAKKVGVTNTQLQTILAQAKQVVANTGDKSCPACRKSVNGVAKFCPACGVSMEQSDLDSATRIDYEIPQTGIVIEFAESTAAGFIDAINRQVQAPSNATCQRAKKTWYMASWPLAQIEEAAMLASSLTGMKNRKLWLDGKEIAWDELFGFLWCYERRQSAYRPIEYCFGIEDRRLNIWGCRNTGLDWTGWSEWFSYGEFKASGLLKKQNFFVFDKQRIRHELETNLFRLRFCPCINFKLIEAIVDVLPKEVEVKPNGKWKYKEEYNEAPGSIKITESESKAGFTFTKEYYAGGVVPRSNGVILELLNLALLKTRSEDPELRKILAYQGE